MTDLGRASPAQEKSQPQVDSCVVLVYHVTMETADICSEHRPEEPVTPTSACTGLHKYTHTHPEGKQDRKLSGEIRVNILFLLWDFNSKISLWRFKYIKSHPQKCSSFIHSCIPISLCVYCLLVLCWCLSSQLSAIHQWVFCFSQWAKWNSVPGSLLSLPKLFKTPIHLSFLVSYSFLLLSTLSCTHEEIMHVHTHK